MAKRLLCIRLWFMSFPMGLLRTLRQSWRPMLPAWHLVLSVLVTLDLINSAMSNWIISVIIKDSIMFMTRRLADGLLYGTVGIIHEFEAILKKVGFPESVYWNLSSNGRGVVFFGEIDLDVYKAYVTKFGDDPIYTHDLRAHVISGCYNGNTKINGTSVNVTASHENAFGSHVDKFISTLEANAKELARTLNRIGFDILNSLSETQLNNVCNSEGYYYVY